ncbi:MAG: phage tail protein [Flavobacteriaceae bacterium]|nr:phage tail protein [Flavobacteriaceae bacterium]
MYGDNPVLSYRFLIQFSSRTGFGTFRAQSVNGLGYSLNLTEFNTTGGPKALPSDVTYDNLIIKRAILELPQPMETSTQTLLNTLEVEQIEMAIFLLDEQGWYTRSWLVSGAYTVKWNTTDFDATSNDVIIETMEYKYEQLIQVL